MIRVETSGKTTILHLARQPLNAINLAFTRALLPCVEQLGADPPKGGLVIASDAKAFSVGVDYKETPHLSANEQQEMVQNINRTAGALYQLPVPTVAAVNGHAMGGGFVLTLACDFRLITTGDHKLGLQEVRAGIPYPAVPLLIVKDRLDPTTRNDLVLSGRAIGPGDALHLGLCTELVESGDDLLPRAVETAAKLASLPGYAAVKNQLNAETVSTIQDVIEHRSDPMVNGWLS